MHAAEMAEEYPVVEEPMAGRAAGKLGGKKVGTLIGVSTASRLLELALTVR